MLAYLSLIADAQRFIKLLAARAAFGEARIGQLQQSLTQHPIEVADGNSLALQQPQKAHNVLRTEYPLQCGLQLLELLQLFDFETGLLKGGSRLRLHTGTGHPRGRNYSRLKFWAVSI